MANYTIDSVEEAIGLLLLVARVPGLGVTELAQRSGNTKARAFRMLHTLEKSGLLFRDNDAPTYSLGYNALYLGVAAEGQISLARLAKNHLREVGIACNENVQIRIRDGHESVCIARWESTHHIRVQTELGNRRPLYVGASGKILLAFAPEEVREHVLNSERVSYTGSTLVSRQSLRQSVNRILRIGYTVSYGEMSVDAVAIAAPIFNANADVVAAISIAGPSSRITEEEVPKMIALVVKAAQELSAHLGYL
jgi:DNA-binding IclR family transcriptional regulator